MYFRRFWVVAAIGLIVLALLIGGSATAQRNAWMQGYLMGRMSTGSDGAAAQAIPPWAFGNGYFGAAPAFPTFGVVILIGLGVFFLFGVGRLCGRKHWQRPDGPEGESHAHGWSHPPHWWPEWGEAPHAHEEGHGSGSEPPVRV